MRLYSELYIKHALTVPLSFEIKMNFSEETDIERPGTSGTSNFFFNFGQNDDSEESETENELMFLDRGFGPDHHSNSSSIILDDNFDQISSSGKADLS
jgi:hypothetical protein